MKFTDKTKIKLGFYVYALVDPRTERIFYIGKASANNRAFDHLKRSKNETEKTKFINEIRSSGYEPKVEILRSGLSTENMAFEVEAAVIDSIGLENLTNKVRGHGVENGRILAIEAERLYGSKPYKISDLKDMCIAFFIHNSYSPTMSEYEIYECTRQAWYQVATARRDSNIKTAIGVVNGIVVRAYHIVAWFPAGTTFSTQQHDNPNLWEFIGNIISDHYLVGRQLVDDNGHVIKAAQRGFLYLPR